MDLLAESIVTQRNVLFITGAGISVPSGIRPFRSRSDALWSEVVYTNATRQSFRKSPLDWYNSFWLRYFPSVGYGSANPPNAGHEALAELTTLPHTDIKVITQNVDGLHSRTETSWDHKAKLIEAHGRVGLYKCVPDDDSESESDKEDEEENRLVKLGSRRKGREQRILSKRGSICRYEVEESLPLADLHPLDVREALQAGKTELTSPPLCPECRKPCLPQALLFDEGYHSHAHYQFEAMENWMSNAEIIVFVGTSFQVSLTDTALAHCRDKGLEVYNFNLERLEGSRRLNVENILGDAEIMLVRLLSVCRNMLGL